MLVGCLLQCLDSSDSNLVMAAVSLAIFLIKLWKCGITCIYKEFQKLT